MVCSTMKELKAKRANRPVLIFDLDNTVIFAEEFSKFLNDREKMSKVFMQLDTSKSKLSFSIMEPDFIIFKRPYFDKFFDFVFKNFDVGIWTKGDVIYAEYIKDNMIATEYRRRRYDNDIQWFYTWDDCRYINNTIHESKNDDGLLNDKLLWYIKISDPSRNYILIDDREACAIGQEDNCINVKEWNYFEVDGDDLELVRVRELLEKFL